MTSKIHFSLKPIQQWKKLPCYATMRLCILYRIERFFFCNKIMENSFMLFQWTHSKCGKWICHKNEWMNLLMCATSMLLQMLYAGCITMGGTINFAHISTWNKNFAKLWLHPNSNTKKKQENIQNSCSTRVLFSTWTYSLFKSNLISGPSLVEHSVLNVCMHRLNVIKTLKFNKNRLCGMH